MSCHDDTEPVMLSAVVMMRPEPTESLPDPASAEALRSTFERLGFDVGPAVALSFSISGSDALFDERFPSAAPMLELLEQSSSDAAPTGEVLLPLDDLLLRGEGAAVEAIFFPERPDFGPGNP